MERPMRPCQGPKPAGASRPMASYPGNGKPLGIHRSAGRELIAIFGVRSGQPEISPPGKFVPSSVTEPTSFHCPPPDGDAAAGMFEFLFEIPGAIVSETGRIAGGIA